MLERTARLLQIRFYVGKHCALLPGRVSNGGTLVAATDRNPHRSARVARKEYAYFCTRDDRALPPRHQTAALERLMCCKSHHAVSAAGQPVDLAEGTAIHGRSL